MGKLTTATQGCRVRQREWDGALFRRAEWTGHGARTLTSWEWGVGSEDPRVTSVCGLVAPHKGPGQVPGGGEG